MERADHELTVKLGFRARTGGFFESVKLELNGLLLKK